MKNRTLLYISFFAMLISACAELEQPIDWETENIPVKLVVEGSVTSQLLNHSIKLSQSADYFANKPPVMISDAVITVTGNGETHTYSESQTQSGVYISNVAYAADVNAEYSLNIELQTPIEGKTSYSATTKIIETMKVDTMYAELYLDPFSESDEDSLILTMVLEGMEPAMFENYYLVKFYRNSEILNDSIDSYFIFSDTDFDYNGDEYIFLNYSGEFEPNDTVGVELFSITEHYYEFIKGCQQISEPTDPFGFSGPPANALGNVNNGEALGYFFGADMVFSNTIVIDGTDE